MTLHRYTCEICEKEINYYVENWYTALRNGEILAKCVCETCAENHPEGVYMLCFMPEKHITNSECHWGE